jgi:hypothetical protein
MNIFILSKDTKKCAQYYCNKHVLKILIEVAQMLCGAHIVLDSVTTLNNVQLYRLTHKNHPCSIWTRTSSANYQWLYNLCCELCKEYTFRYGKVHKIERTLLHVLKNTPVNISSGELTPFALAMPDECKSDDAVESYRKYYLEHKKHLFDWKIRERPEWIA